MSSWLGGSSADTSTARSPRVALSSCARISLPGSAGALCAPKSEHFSAMFVFCFFEPSSYKGVHNQRPKTGFAHRATRGTHNESHKHARRGIRSSTACPRPLRRPPRMKGYESKARSVRKPTSQNHSLICECWRFEYARENVRAIEGMFASPSKPFLNLSEASTRPATMHTPSVQTNPRRHHPPRTTSRLVPQPKIHPRHAEDLSKMLSRFGRTPNISKNLPRAHEPLGSWGKRPQGMWPNVHKLCAQISCHRLLA